MTETTPRRRAGCARSAARVTLVIAVTVWLAAVASVLAKAVQL